MNKNHVLQRGILALLTLIGLCVGRTALADCVPWNGSVAQACLDTTEPMPAPTDPSKPVYGWADLHSHQFANLGFGGQLVAGEPFGPVDTALKSCQSIHGLTGLADLPGNSVRSTIDPAPLLIDGHYTDGSPSFNGWPRWDTVDHQTMYYKWLKRSFLDGEKLLVVLAVTNQALCEIQKPADGFDCTDETAVEKQIAAIKNMDKEIDLEDDGVRNHSGWYQVAYSAEQARKIISEGKLAVVIGVETDSPFNCNETSPWCTQANEAYVAVMLQRYYDLGVRQMFPIHVFDNAFGGTAVYNSMFLKGNKIVNGKFVTLRTCSTTEQNDGIGFAADNGNWITNALAGLIFGTDVNFPDDLAPPPQCNAKGITEVGKFLIRRMMQLGMIIDTDHMSNLMFNWVLHEAEDKNYALIASHTVPLNEFKWGEGAEGSRTDAQLQKIFDLGGMIAINLATKTRAQLKHPATAIPFTCDDSDQGWDQQYQYAVDLMKNHNDGLVAVGLGSDFNGFIFEPAPRFGYGSAHIPPCGYTDPDTNTKRVSYPFTSWDGKGVFYKQQTGQKTYDFNADGMAHEGMLPDFIADLKAQGVTEAQLQPFYHSAEKYLEMWEKDEHALHLTPPAVVATPDRTAINGWYKNSVNITLSLKDPQENARIYYLVTGAAATGSWYPLPVNSSAGPVTVHINKNGASEITFYSINTVSKNKTPVQTLDVLVDAVVPTLQFHIEEKPSLFSSFPNNWYNTDVHIDPEATDNESGAKIIHYVLADGTKLDYPPNRQLDLTHEGTTSFTATVEDQIGHISNPVSVSVSIDKTPPTISLSYITPRPPDSDWYTGPVTANFTCADQGGSQLVSCSTTRTLSDDGAGQQLLGVAFDQAGNSATYPIDNVNIDSTPPTITATRLPAANENGWNDTDVTLSFTCYDKTSKVRDCSAKQVVSKEGAGQTVTGTVTDNAGHTSSVTVSDINIDKTKPTITDTRTPGPNAWGWNNTDVSVAFNCKDDLSHIDTCGGDKTLQEETDAGTVTGTAVDKAGNIATLTVDQIKIDKTKPTISASRTPAPNGAGWNNADVTVSYDCKDALSGVADCSSDQTLDQDGKDQWATGIVTDKAGNSAKVTLAGISIDKTPPLVTASRDPGPNGNGWNNTDVSVSFQCSDATSGLVGGCNGDTSLSREGKGQSVTGWAEDLAGNVGTFTVKDINIDRTSPTLACASMPSILWPPNNKFVNVSNQVTISDNLSGPGPVKLTAVDDSDSHPRDTSFSGWTLGTFDTSGLLRAEKAGNGSGNRRYTMSYKGTDLAGNTGSCVAIVQVPHSQANKVAKN